MENSHTQILEWNNAGLANHYCQKGGIQETKEK